MGASAKMLFSMINSAFGLLPVRMPFWLSKKAQFLNRSLPASKRIPAPLPSGTRVPRNSMFSIRKLPSRITQIAFPSACLPAAIGAVLFPEPRIVSAFCCHTATSPIHSPGPISTMSPSFAICDASAIVLTVPPGPTRITRAKASVGRHTLRKSRRRVRRTRVMPLRTLPSVLKWHPWVRSR